ncbi:ABC transporter permease [Paenibacillus profundus]|uniref:ABC transporter permease n=1 Tax=Paenibacillus profundus TaxID=1173085 RepID=A0ABS8YMP7_9BACL|nr:ABC transporter permease [Paenibacillus profundus]MCE5173096.1 ABC transporter permease [Paenibacillus profundus]
MDQIAKKGKLIITVIHSQKVADSGSRIVKIEDGRVVEDVRLKDAYRSIEKTEQTNPKSLSLFSSFKLALKNMKLNAKRNILVSVGGSIGIISVILMLSLGSGVTNYINDEINSSMNPLMIEITKQAEDNENGSDQSMPIMLTQEPFTQENMEQIKNILNVSSIEKATAYNMKSNAVLGDKRSAIIQFSTITNSIKEDNIEAGKLPADNEILITSTLAKALSSNEQYQSVIGKEISVYVNDIGHDNKPVIVEAKLKVSGVYNAGNMGPQGMTAAYVPYETLEAAFAKQELTLRPTQINAFADKQEHVEGIKETLKDDGYADSQTAAMLEQVTTYLDMATVILAGISGISLMYQGS